MSEEIAEIRESMWMNRMPGNTVIISEDKLNHILSELDRITTERDKAIEGLKWYSHKPRYSSAPRNPEIYPYQQTPEVYGDGGNCARTILKELGVDMNE